MDECEFAEFLDQISRQLSVPPGVWWAGPMLVILDGAPNGAARLVVPFAGTKFEFAGPTEMNEQ